MLFCWSKSNVTYSKILSSLLQSLNGTSKILLLGTPKVLVFSRTISLNLLEPAQDVFLTVTTISLCHYNQSIQNCINPICSCGMDIEWISHFFNRDEWIFLNRNTTVWQFWQINSLILNVFLHFIHWNIWRTFALTCSNYH